MAEHDVSITTTFEVAEFISRITGNLAILDTALENIRKLHSAGVRIAVGTDRMKDVLRNRPTIPLGEYHHLLNCGLTLHEVITAATKNSAYVCGLEQKTGAIRPGMWANIIATALPLDESLSALGHIEFVMNRGTVIRDFPI